MDQYTPEQLLKANLDALFKSDTPEERLAKLDEIMSSAYFQILLEDDTKIKTIKPIILNELTNYFTKNSHIIDTVMVALFGELYINNKNVKKLYNFITVSGGAEEESLEEDVRTQRDGNTAETENVIPADINFIYITNQT
jgi:hypothetical protein